MNRTAHAMQGFLWELKNRSARIKRAGRLDSLEFSPIVDGQFTVTAQWSIKGGKTEQHVKLYTPDVAFRAIGTGKMVPRDRPCNMVTKFIMEIQRQQGVRR